MRRRQLHVANARVSHCYMAIIYVDTPDARAIDIFECTRRELQAERRHGTAAAAHAILLCTLYEARRAFRIRSDDHYRATHAADITPARSSPSLDA